MSGIVGIVKNREEAVTEQELSLLADTLSHRGPDGRASFVKKNVGLAHLFLKIPSPVSVPQPLHSEDGQLTIVCDGRVFNHAPLKAQLEAAGHRFATTSDVEVLLHLYEEKGERFLDEVNGMFALALWDGHRNRLLLARDRIGIKPLYYTRAPGALLFASEIKAILAEPSVKRRVNFRAMSDFFGLSYIFDGETMFEDILALPPGSMLLFDGGGSGRTQRYWDMRFAPDHPWDQQELMDEGLKLLKDAVALQMADVDPVGIHLSGGIDSSLITSFAAGMADDPEHVITLSAGFREEDYDERNFALEAARHAGVTHQTIEVFPDAGSFMDTMRKVIWHVDEPTVSPGIHSFYVLSEFTSRFVKVVLGGQGSNELLAGYNRYIMANIGEDFAWRLKSFRLSGAFADVRQMYDFYGPKPLKGLFLEAAKKPNHRALRLASTFAPGEKEKLFSSWLKKELDQYSTGERYRRGFDLAPAATTIDRMMYLDMKNMMPNMLRILDRTCAAFGVEPRTPFLDHRFVEYATGLSDDAVLQGTESKYILKKMSEGILRHDTIYREKSGFAAPVTPWLQGHLRREARAVILSERALGRGYFDEAGLHWFVDRHEASGKGVWQVWMLLIFELWHRTFIDR